MAVCEKCNLAYSRLESNIHQLENNIQEKEKLINGIISVALAQSKLISYIQSSRLNCHSPMADINQYHSWCSTWCPCGDPCSWCDGTWFISQKCKSGGKKVMIIEISLVLIALPRDHSIKIVRRTLLGFHRPSLNKVRVCWWCFFHLFSHGRLMYGDFNWPLESGETGCVHMKMSQSLLQCGAQLIT